MFVKKGELPKSFTQSRNFYILLTVAIVAIANYTFYAIYTQVLTKDYEYDKVWILGFGQQCIIALILTTSMIFLGISNFSIKNLKKTLRNTPENLKQLNHYHRITRVAFMGQSIFLAIVLFGIYTQGVFGPFAIL